MYPEGTATAFQMAADLGYDGVEVMVGTDAPSQDSYALLDLMQTHQVPVLSIHSPCLLVTQRVWGTEPWGKLRRAQAVAEQLGAAGPQREDRGDRAVVVGGTAARAAIDEHPPDPLSRVAALGMGEEGLDARPRVGDGPAALLATGLRGLGGGLTQRVRQACQIGGIVEKDGPVVFVAEQVLAEGRGQRRQLLVERRELRLRCGIEPRTVADKMGVGQPDDPLLLGRQRCLLP